MRAQVYNGKVIRGMRAALALALFAGLTCAPLVVAAQAAPPRATVTIDARGSVGAISPMLYGQFVEFMFEGVKGGMYAELLRDRSFEEAPNAIGLPRYWERYPDDRDDDYALNFAWDETVHYPLKPRTDIQGAEHSLRVETGDGVIPRHGIFQSRIPVRAGVEYKGYLWLKCADYRGAVNVALESDVLGGPVYAETTVASVGGDWRKYEFTLRPNRSDPLARFAVLFAGRGRAWLDQVSLMPGDAAAGGVRRDVFERVASLRPAFIRWPGGNVAQDYHWLWGTGARDERPTWINLSWKNEPEPSDFGTDEYVNFARAVGAEPALTVNVEGRGATAEEAAHWVEYCNGPASSKYGAMRAANGHAAPYNVKLWEVGNEIWGAWVRGHSDAETYARNFMHYAAAMRRVDPTIKLIAVGDNDMNWNRTVVSRAGAEIDYLAIHHYYGRHEMAGDVGNLLAHPIAYEHFYVALAQLLRTLAPQREIKLAINEWGLDLPVGEQYSMLSALYGARLMNVFERTDGLVAMSAVSDLVNGWPGGIIQAGRTGLFVSPIYLVNQLYSTHLGAERLATQINSPTFDTSREGQRVPVLDAVASRTQDRKQIFVKLVNTDLKRALPTTINVPDARIVPGGELETVNAPTLAAANSFTTPGAVSLARTSVGGGANFQLTLPPHSVSVLTLRVAQ
jgi:alpha-L-arabinofuranosidase